MLQVYRTSDMALQCVLPSAADEVNAAVFNPVQVCCRLHIRTPSIASDAGPHSMHPATGHTRLHAGCRHGLWVLLPGPLSYSQHLPSAHRAQRSQAWYSLWMQGCGLAYGTKEGRVRLVKHRCEAAGQARPAEQRGPVPMELEPEDQWPRAS